MESIDGILTQPDFDHINLKILELQAEQDKFGIDNSYEIARLRAMIEEDDDMFDGIEDEDED